MVEVWLNQNAFPPEQIVENTLLSRKLKAHVLDQDAENDSHVVQVDEVLECIKGLPLDLDAERILEPSHRLQFLFGINVLKELYVSLLLRRREDGPEPGEEVA